MASHFFASAVLLALVVADRSVLEESRVDVDVALLKDDQCLDGSARCALNALQIKAARGLDSAETVPEEEDPCTFGFVGMMRNQGPECFAACPQICEPLGEAVTAFFQGGGGLAAKRSVCSNKEKFYCTTLDENVDKCKPLVEFARQMRVDLPDNVSAFQERCALVALQAAQGVPDLETLPFADFVSEDAGSVSDGISMHALALAEGASESDPCKAGLVGKMREQGPECFDACPQICQPLTEAVRAFFQRGGAPAAKSSICMSEHKFWCTTEGENVHKCKPLVESARHMGVELPQTVPAIQKECSTYR